MKHNQQEHPEKHIFEGGPQNNFFGCPENNFSDGHPEKQHFAAPLAGAAQTTNGPSNSERANEKNRAKHSPFSLKRFKEIGDQMLLNHKEDTGKVSPALGERDSRAHVNHLPKPTQ